MATYAVGDLQGCLTPLQQLLERVSFSQQDELWLAGDLVNRGPQSLQTLRFIKSLGTQAKVILGNHDLHLLALYNRWQSHSEPNHKQAHTNHQLPINSTLAPIFAAEDLAELMVWLQTQPLLHYDAQRQAVMTHAGIPPCWDLPQAQSYAEEIHKVLTSTQANHYFANMYGDQPKQWHEQLTGTERWRCITNFFTRMRYLDTDDDLELDTKCALHQAPKHLTPWFLYPSKINVHQYFGHWAALEGHTGVDKIVSLDMGCVWQGSLKMVRLEDQQVFIYAYSTA